MYIFTHVVSMYVYTHIYGEREIHFFILVYLNKYEQSIYLSIYLSVDWLGRRLKSYSEVIRRQHEAFVQQGRALAQQSRACI